MSDFLCNEVLPKKKEQYLNYQNVINALEDGTIEHYDLDTGQTRQRVTRANRLELQKAMEHLLSEIDRLEKRCSGKTSQYGHFGTGW